MPGAIRLLKNRSENSGDWRWWGRLPFQIGFTRATITILAVLAGLFLARHASPQAADAYPTRPAGASGGTLLYLPLVKASPFDLKSAWTREVGGPAQLAYLAGTSYVHQLSGTTYSLDSATALIKITTTGPCGVVPIFSEEVELPPGSWQQSFPASVPGCPGVYTSDVTLEFGDYSKTVQTRYVINEPFQPLLTGAQGFDRCVPPSAAQMAAWWTESPYSVFNIYLGGIHFPLFCQDPNQDAFWVHEVASQGWKFTAIWVGPQPPCTNFTHRFSLSPSTAYQQGQTEADAAAVRARELGLFGDLTLHYDIEGYSSTATTACRTATNAFLQGWTDRLHELNLRAGAYGGGCSSFITDWHDNNPVIDQVWIAHWSLPAAYNPDATVWNAACVSNSLWVNQQRLKQYAGDHAETWGGVTLTIDSNVFDTTALGWAAPATASSATGVFVESFGPLGSSSGWLLSGGRLFRTEDLGQTWSDITPENFIPLAAEFNGPETGWVAGWRFGEEELYTGRTTDGGRTWSLAPLGVPEGSLGAVYLEVLDGTHVWLALKLQSGSSFSLGLLYASEDGGATWELRAHPLGEPVHFVDADNGWTQGGPDGRQAFVTTDGGRTWAAAAGGLPDEAWPLTIPESTVRAAVLDERHAWVLVQAGNCVGEKAAQVCELHEQLWRTGDGGLSWTVVSGPAVEDP